MNFEAYVAVAGPNDIEQYAETYGGCFSNPLSALIARNYFDGQIKRFLKLKRKGKLNKLFLDAGTYTRNKAGLGPSLNHDFEPYMDLIVTEGKHFDLIAAYDIDFKDPERCQDFTSEMFRRLDGTELRDKIVPVIHDARNAAEEFELYADMGAKVIAIGSEPTIPKEQWALINRIRFWRDISIHIFGNLGCSLLKSKKPESADSARYAHDAKYGDICVWNSRTQNLERVHVLNADEYTDEIRSFVKTTFGFDPEDLMRVVRNKWMVNMYGIHQMQEFLSQEWYPKNEVQDW